ncbi:hypothetical protein CSKR_100250 [Clonorchis sinensis]|uniref:Uncharacterized protein n=1 Tax=Clonorchis sinensis TaxID=79923 RepID=A0A419PDY3_CLOSI|nr:hypothetical protein CSKR_100250 [Clonorchis sinensis]
MAMQNNVLVTSHVTLVGVQTINTNSVDPFACLFDIHVTLGWCVVLQNWPFELLHEISIETDD